MALLQAPAKLALWLHLRRRAAVPVPGHAVAAPPGEGPLILLHLAEQPDDPPPVAALVRALLHRRPNLRLIFTGAPPPAEALPSGLRASIAACPQDPAGARQMIDATRPRALLVLGDQMPPALISAMTDEGLPVILAEARLTRQQRRGPWRGAIDRGLMRRIDRVLAPDLTAAAAARHMGADPAKVELIGPVTETRPPLPVNEAERRALAQILAGRHIWLAAAPTLPEARAVLAAHQATLQHNHRALLILAGLPPQTIPAIQAEVQALGLAAVLRSEDDDPSADDHVLIAEDSYEMGLWYRLAPVCFMGGTLLPGEALPPRHPFEPAALGSAIIHGPLTDAHGAEWGQLDGASAARLVLDSNGLARAAADLSAPDQAALLAGNAWSVCTGGAAVLRRIADTVLQMAEVQA
ncbi:MULTISPECIES: 3-deoxy-D-manno-octulosonic acid transferase [unclassified Paracoccus (in: a-proteobacteria)]|uniref:3-deoxy-D-manno-octulosonic acid transferase n=1 Tax=unclassified Paracoccus (in: a-proteobacteria) TaxID=2688777 RepID=UPI0012B1BE82|nr:MULTISPECIES: glycosyltransferase N-terminal domain-containing protein [unclassified Paracoccus (in: a-proteobacteria)]UXU75089.1 3-deoxy-D-manno-octulosonic acid transferase [Paracoccus sp. SMMA_5]UXU80992.1 3-deoxy-D-manno-octulosonic acid transferase [Paracoccus sp. SMMA_5_TC]